MRTTVFLIVAGLIWPFSVTAGEISVATSECLDCHRMIHPGIVAEWQKSHHAEMTVQQALQKPALERRVSVSQAPDSFASTVVGCAECHTQNPEKHKDTFEHAGYRVHTVVTPEDCSTCHPTEARQFSLNLMSHAYGNLRGNPIYHDLAQVVNGIQSLGDKRISFSPPDKETNLDSCYSCHGSVVEMQGIETRDTVLGEMDLPILSGWPNQGVGRINPDGSKGACTACHTRHQFSIEMARKPYTCSQCHKGPDVPAYPVYQVSKHGNKYFSHNQDWNFEAVPWTVGKDFGAPTCATCHISLLVNMDGEVVAERTHRMADRLPWRLMGLIYAHPHPKSPDTTIIRNTAGLPLPTALTGEPATEYLIDADEQTRRRQTMQGVCLACHSSGWVKGHWTRFENTIRTTNEMTLTATQIMLRAWEAGVAKGLDQNDSIFNEALERKWVEQWLFYANSTRFASAMMGADYGVFANGRWHLSKNIQEMADWVEFKTTGRGDSD
jgi:hypothetical protein